MKKNKISKNWINKQRRDIYVRQAKVDGYRSRAAYKLIEIDQKFKILKNGISLIDLGAAPGSWSQYASKSIKNGKILSIDLKKIDPIDKVEFVEGDFTKNNTQQNIKNYFKSKVDVVLSDMAENTTGIKNVDSTSTGELCAKKQCFFQKMYCLKMAHLSQKYSWDPSFNEIILNSKSIFKETKVFKPNSSRKDSKESFIICKFLR